MNLMMKRYMDKQLRPLAVPKAQAEQVCEDLQAALARYDKALGEAMPGTEAEEAAHARFLNEAVTIAERVSSRGRVAA